MATYREIHGKAIKTVTTNPSDDAAEGQIWFNSTDNTFKSIVSLEAMTSGTSMSNTRGQNGTAHNGTQNAALSVTGNNNGGGSNLVTNTSEEYNGSGWTSGGTYPISSFGSYGSGVQTAALFSGGRTGSPPFPVTNTSASYNGTSFGAEGNLSTARQSAGCFGATENTSIAAGGHNVPGSYTDTEEYNGSAWTTVPATFPSQDNMGAAGVQTAAIANANGGTGTFLFDGSAWTGGPSMNTARSSLNQAMMGLTQDAVVALGANPSANNAIENYDGTSWTTSSATLGTGRAQSASSGSNTAGVLFGGTTTAYVAVTEEYNRSASVFTAASWSSGPSMNTARDELGSALNAPAPTALAMGGYNSSPSAGLTICEEYNGSAWSESGDLNNITWQMAGAGTQTAAVSMGGAYNPFTIMANTEEYNGSTWTAVTAMPTATWGAGGTGSQTAALVFGGNAPGIVSTTFEYDGTNYSPGGALNTARTYTTGFGIQTAALCAGGNTPSKTGATEEYNGSAWTSSGSLITARDSLCGGGAQTDGLVFTGSSGPGTPNILAVTEGYDGTAWSTRPSVSTARIFAEGTGGTTSSAAAIIYGGAPGGGPFIANSEEFTGETSSLNVKTLTQS